VAALLRVELLSDTTSTYFELDEEDEPVLRGEDGSPAPAAGAPGGDGGHAAGGSGNGREMAGFRAFGGRVLRLMVTSCRAACTAVR
jgi:hypothetical protein